jgi:hypothetical protein
MRGDVAGDGRFGQVDDADGRGKMDVEKVVRQLGLL